MPRQDAGGGVRGRLIAFEGPEGAGKSTHAAALAARLQELGIPVLLTSEPGATPLGKTIRALVLDPHREPPSPRAELLLYLADRAEHIDRRIRPALADGWIVVTDRFSGSTLAYQGYGRGLDLKILRRFDRFARSGLAVDLTLLLDCPPEEGLRRARGSDRFHEEQLEFHQRVRNGFLELAQRERPRWHVIDTRHPPAEVRQAIDRIVLAFLRRSGHLRGERV